MKNKPFVERVPHFKLVEPFETYNVTQKDCGEIINFATKTLGKEYTVLNVIHESAHDPIELLDMWDRASVEHWKNFDTVKNNFLELKYQHYELILNFLIMIGVDV